MKFLMINSVPPKGIVKTGRWQGVCVDSWKSPERWTGASLAFCNVPNLHAVDIIVVAHDCGYPLSRYTCRT